MAEKTKIEQAVAEIDKKYGKGTIVDFTANADNSIKRISSGSIGLDLALGGGWPEGRIVELYGPESSGKTTLATQAMVEAQKEGYKVALVDAEHAFDPIYAEILGLDISGSNFIFTQPDTGEQALDITETLIKTGDVKVIIVDSVAALVPKSEVEGEYGETKMGVMARLMSQAMRRMNGMISKNNCIVIFINQIRMKIGVMYGNPEVTTGGNALQFYASIRCDIRRIGQEKDGDEVTASRTRVKVIKNKTYPPFKNTEFNIAYGEGIDTVREIVDIATDEKVAIIKKSGSWYSYGDTKLGQGADGVKKLMQDNPELLEKITKEVRKKLNLK